MVSLPVEFDYDEKVNGRVSALFELSFGEREVTIDKVWNDVLKHISENVEGARLLNRIDAMLKAIDRLWPERLGSKTVHITAKEGGTYFTGRSFRPATKRGRFPVQQQTMSVSLNLDVTHRSVVWSEKEKLCSLIPSIGYRVHVSKYLESNTGFCATSICADPFWLTVAHELIHMEHFLTEELNKYVCECLFGKCKDIDGVRRLLSDQENLNRVLKSIQSFRENIRNIDTNGIDIFNKLPSGYIGLKELEDYYTFLNNPLRFHARYSKNKEICNWSDISDDVLHMCPELMARREKKQSLAFWCNLEERETVIGKHCSELTMRISAQMNEKGKILLPIRYLYQDTDKFFLEGLDVLLELINLIREDSFKINKISKDELIDWLTSDQLSHLFNVRMLHHTVSEEMLSDFDYNRLVALKNKNESKRKNRI